MEKVKRSFFYLLLVFLPVQLGYHFFFDFSFISGIRSDYLAPTIYLTDIIIVFLIVLWFIEKIKNLNFNTILKLKFWPFWFFIVYLLFNSLFVSLNHWVALYKFVKILEFFLLVIVIIGIRPNVVAVIFFLSIGIIYSGILAILQFVLGRSVGGFFYFLGERTFYVGTPGIATISLNNILLLRPYATFPHPNVLGGFLAVLLPLIFSLIFFNKKNISVFIQIYFGIILILGVFVLFLTFSRAAWIIFLWGLVLVFLVNKKKIILWFSKNKGVTLLGFYSLLLLSVVSFQIVPHGSESVFQRRELIKASLEIIFQNPLFGIGLNNFVVVAKNYLPKVVDLYIFQPVHNIYLLVFSELGLVGFVGIITIIYFVFLKSLKTDPLVLVAILELVFLGFFDHYLFTLQQAQLLFIVFISLALSKSCDQRKPLKFFP